MKKLFLIILTLAFLLVPLSADWTGKTAFLATAITVAADTVEVVGTGIATHSLPLGSQEIIGITCVFIPAGAAADTVDFYFEDSANGRVLMYKVLLYQGRGRNGLSRYHLSHWHFELLIYRMTRLIHLIVETN